MYKSGPDFQSFIDDVFRNKIRIKNDVFFLSQPKLSERDGIGRSTFYATRHDYMRIAKSILNDWEADNCVGKYLKAVYDKRDSKGGSSSKADTAMSAWKSYGGFFHADAAHLGKANVLAMSGYGGQDIVIDFDKKRILSVHAIHVDYDWSKVVLETMKSGIPK
jgi:hypothetical protein